jgi:hypothetical protein
MDARVSLECLSDCRYEKSIVPVGGRTSMENRASKDRFARRRCSLK